jgi:hypothetical protein
MARVYSGRKNLCCQTNVPTIPVGWRREVGMSAGDVTIVVEADVVEQPEM